MQWMSITGSASHLRLKDVMLVMALHELASVCRRPPGPVSRVEAPAVRRGA